MRVFLAFLGYFIACMLLSAVLLPWLQPWFAQWFGAPPDRSLYRFGMLLTALGLPLLLRFLQLSDRSTLGWRAPPGGMRPALQAGLLLGSLMLTLVVLGLGVLGVRELKTDHLQTTHILSAAASGLASGLVVGLIEEFFFRGPLQGGMRRTQAFWPTAILISLFYSIVHFIRPTPLQGQALDIHSSLGMILGGLGQLAEIQAYADSFLTLVLAGIFLSMIRERSGSLFMAIGVHAGWVLVIRLTKALSDTDQDSPWIWTIGDYDNVTGWLASGVIALFAVAYWIRGKPQKTPQPA